MLKKIGLVVLALVVLAGMVVGGKVYVEKRVEETKEALIIQMLQEKEALVTQILQEKEALITAMLQEKEALRAEIIKQFDTNYLVEVLGREGTIKLLKGDDYGNFDLSHALVEVAGSNPDDLKKLERKIIIEAYSLEGEKIAEGIAPVTAWIYDDDLVVAHPLASKVPFWFLFIDLLEIAKDGKITVKAYLLPDPNQEPDLVEAEVREELGEITSNPLLDILLIERVDPVIETPVEQYRSPNYKFEELAGGEAVYQMVQDGNRIEFLPAFIRGTYTDEEGRNLIDVEFPTRIGDLGGLLFGVRNGKFELIGLTSIIGEERVYAEDINQVAAYIEKETGKVYIEQEETQPEEAQSEEKVYTLENYPRDPDPQNKVEVVVAFFFYLQEEKYWEAAKLVKGAEAKVASGEIPKEWVINYLTYVLPGELEKVVVEEVGEDYVTVVGHFENDQPPPVTRRVEVEKEDDGWKIVYEY